MVSVDVMQHSTTAVTSEHKRCVRAQVDVRGSPSPKVQCGLCGCKATPKKKKKLPRSLLLSDRVQSPWTLQPNIHSFCPFTVGWMVSIKVTFFKRQQREHRLPQKSVNGTCDARPPVDGIRQGITYNYLSVLWKRYQYRAAPSDLFHGEGWWWWWCQTAQPVQMRSLLYKRLICVMFRPW